LSPGGESQSIGMDLEGACELLQTNAVFEMD